MYRFEIAGDLEIRIANVFKESGPSTHIGTKFCVQIVRSCLGMMVYITCLYRLTTLYVPKYFMFFISICGVDQSDSHTAKQSVFVKENLCS